MWKYGYANSRNAQPDRDWLSGYANYMSKMKMTQEKVGKHKWKRSKNLIKPDERRMECDFSAGQVMQMAEEMGKHGSEKIEESYPEFEVIDKPTIRHSVVVPGVYLCFRMLRRGADVMPAEYAILTAGGDAVWQQNGRRSRKDISTDDRHTGRLLKNAAAVPAR